MNEPPTRARGPRLSLLTCMRGMLRLASLSDGTALEASGQMSLEKPAQVTPGPCVRGSLRCAEGRAPGAAGGGDCRLEGWIERGQGQASLGGSW